MEAPLGLSNAMREVVEKAPGGMELYRTIVEWPFDQIVEFFDCAADAQTWVEERGGNSFMGEMLPFLNSAVLRHRCTQAEALVIGKAIRRNSKYLLKYLPEDVSFLIRGERFKVSSLLFRVFGGDYFSSLIDDCVVSRKQSEIELREVSPKVFAYIKEFFYSEKMENLWKEQPKVILALQKAGNSWRLKDVSDYAFDTYKNYINREVLFRRLVAAFQEKNIHLTEELLGVLEHEQLGFKMRLIAESGFSLSLESLYGEVESLLNPILKAVYSIDLLRENIEELPFLKLLKQCPRLEEIDLRRLKHPENRLALIENLPKMLKKIDLTDLDWVDDEIIHAIAAHLTNLRVLILSGCTHFQPTILSELSQLKELESVDLSHNQGITTSILRIVAPHFKTVKHLNFSYCQGLNDEGMGLLAFYLSEIEGLNLSGCRQVTEQGVLSLQLKRTLRFLNLRSMPQIPRNFKERKQMKFFRTEILI